MQKFPSLLVRCFREPQAAMNRRLFKTTVNTNSQVCCHIITRKDRVGLRVRTFMSIKIL